MKITFKFKTDDTNHVVYIDEQSVFSPYYNITVEDNAALGIYEESVFQKKIESIAQAIVYRKYNANQVSNKFIITEIRPDAKDPDLFFVDYIDRYGREWNVEVKLPFTSENNATVTADKDYNNAEILEDPDLRHFYIPPATKPPASVYAKPRIGQMMKEYSYDRAKAVAAFGLNWDDHYRQLFIDVNKRRCDVLEPLKQELVHFNAEIKAILDETHVLQDEEYTKFVTEKIAELDLEKFNDKASKGLKQEEARLEEAATKALDKEVQKHHRIYEDHRCQIRFFNHLLAYYLWEAARKYWEAGAHEETFNEKFITIGIQIENGHLSSITQTYNLFDALTLEESQQLILKLLDHTDSKMVKKIPLVGKAINAVAGWSKGLTFVHQGLEAFEAACRTDTAFSVEPYKSFATQPLFTKTDSHSIHLVGSTFYKTYFKWNDNALALEKEVQKQIENDYRETRTELGKDANVAERLYRPLAEEIHRNAPFDSVKNEIRRKINRFTKAPQEIEDHSRLSSSSDSAPPKSIKKQIEERRDLAWLKKIKNDAELSFNQGNQAKESIDAIPAKPVDNKLEYGAAAHEILLFRSFDVRREAENHFNELSKLNEQVKVAIKVDASLKLIPALMKNKSTALASSAEEAKALHQGIVIIEGYKKIESIVENSKRLIDEIDPNLKTEEANVLRNKMREQVTDINMKFRDFKDAIQNLNNVKEKKRLEFLVESLKQSNDAIITLGQELEKNANALHALVPAPVSRVETPVVPHDEVDYIARCNLLVPLVTNLKYWHKKLNFDFLPFFKAGTIAKYNGTELKVQTGIADMVKVINEHGDDYQNDNGKAKALFEALQLKAQEAKKRGAYRGGFVHVRNLKLNCFYEYLADNDVLKLERWKTTYGPESQLNKKKSCWRSCFG